MIHIKTFVNLEVAKVLLYFYTIHIYFVYIREGLEETEI